MPRSSITVLITGASSGIGKAAAEYLSQIGYRVFAGARRPDSISFLNGVDVVQLDVTDEASITKAVDSVMQKAGRIDVLINNAGFSIVAPVEETTIQQTQAIFDTNLLGVLRLSHAVIPGMRQRGSGRIINISSVAGLMPAPYMGVYSASKHAVEALSEALDHEIRAFGIRVAVVEPGYVKTNIDVAALRGDNRLSAYDRQRDRVAAHISAQVAAAADPTETVRKIERAMRGNRFQRYAASKEVKLLKLLRRWLPIALYDRGVRRNFKLDA